jgi:hypothetical protein
VLLGEDALHIGDHGGISQIGGDAPGLAPPARQLSHGVIYTALEYPMITALPLKPPALQRPTENKGRDAQ